MFTVYCSYAPGNQKGIPANGNAKWLLGEFKRRQCPKYAEIQHA